MSLPTSLHSYIQEAEAFEAAAAADRGIRLSFPEEGRARHFLSRLHMARSLDREGNAKALPVESPLNGRSGWDLFTCFVRFDGEKWWVYIRKIEGLGGIFEELTDETYDPPKIEPPKPQLLITDQTFGKVFRR